MAQEWDRLVKTAFEIRRYQGRLRAGGLSLAYDVVDLTQIEPARLLAGPLAPLALLADDGGADLVPEVVDRIQACPTRAGAAMVDLALLAIGDDRTLTAILIEQLRRTTMYSALRDNEHIQQIVAEASATASASARAEALVEGRLTLLRDLIVDRFGDTDQATAAARRLASLPATEAVARIEQATTITDLLT